MVDTKPLLKGFGAAADVIGQIATDKAVNSRRTRSDKFDIQQETFDITKGELVKAGTIPSGTTLVAHNLGTEPKGVFILFADPNIDPAFDSAGEIVVRSADVNTITVGCNKPMANVTLWVV